MAGYRLTKLKEGTHVTLWLDPRGPGCGEPQRGTVSSHVGDSITISWYSGVGAGVDERWNSSDLRYKVDRGLAILVRPPKQRRLRLPKDQLVCRQCGVLRKKGCDCPRPGAIKPEHWGQKSDNSLFTQIFPHDMMGKSNRGDEPPTEEGAMMAKKSATIEELEEVTEEVGGEMLTAKAAATLLGTDGRTLRKFLRKIRGTVGQGARWEIDPSEIDELKDKFSEWSKGGQSRGEAKKTAKVDEDADVEPLADAELDELEEIEDLDFGDDD